MPQKDWDSIEREALAVAGEKAGKYLDRIGKTDLANLDAVEWSMFCRTLIDGFGSELAERLTFKINDAPF